MAENLPTRARRSTKAAPPPRIRTVEEPDPPGHLSDEAAEMWREVVGGWDLGPDALPILRAALEQWDTYQASRRVLAAEGPTVKTGDAGMVRQHPAAAVARDALREYRLLWRQLALQPE